MATKIIKALIDGVVQEIEVEDIISPEQPLSPEERLDILEDKHEVVVADGNLLVGNGTEELEEMTPEEVLSHINGVSVATMTTAEYEAMGDDESNANTLYVLTDDEDDEYYTAVEIDEKVEEINTSISGKADALHTHDDRYYTVDEVDGKLESKSDITHNHDVDYDAFGSAEVALDSAKEYSDDNLAVAKSYADTNNVITLETANTYTDNAVAQKSQVQIITWGDDD